MILFKQHFFRLGLWVALLGSVTTGLSPAFALPPAEDEPEERLRTEIILEARSPMDGEPMTAAEYAELEAQLEAESRNIGTVSPDIRRLIGLLRLRKAIRTILPFF
jgi:hypothetical protein